VRKSKCRFWDTARARWSVGCWDNIHALAAVTQWLLY
jgi:hypothetical protein